MRAKMRILMMGIMMMTMATTMMRRRRRKWKIIWSACLLTASQVEVAKPVTVPGQGSYLRFDD